MKPLFITFCLLLIAAISPVCAVPPDFTVDFSANVTNGTAPLAVQFTSLATGSPVSWVWEMDNQTYTNSSPVHIFTHAGLYDVNLTVTDDTDATLSENKSAYILVNASGKNVSVNFISRTIWGDNPVQFIDRATGRPAAGNYTTSSRGIELPDSDYTLMILPASGPSDLANSPDYALNRFADVSAANVLGLVILIFIVSFFFVRRK